MAQLELYQRYITDLVNKYASYKPSNGDIDMEAITDHEHGHYEVMSVGWDEDERVHACIIHIDIKNNKIWIQENRTDVDIAEELMERGVSKEDIVLGLHPPYIRPYTGFAVN
ncbi:MAG: XisI protein [Caldilineaceae bacterium]